MYRYIIFLCCFFIAMSCKKESSDVLQNHITPGKRDYTWTRDTLSYPGNNQTTMQSMYASSANNVYVVGHCSSSPGRMWRFDGLQWQPVLIPTIWGYLNAISGSSANNIWVVGAQIDSTLIARYDGSTWSQVTGFPRRGALWCAAVLSPTVVFAGGEKGALYRLSGSTWDVFDAGQHYFFSSIAAISANEAYAIGFVNDAVPPVDSSGSFLFQFNGSGWAKIDSVMRTPNPPPSRIGGSGVYAYGTTLYTLGGGVFRREASAWSKLVDGVVGHMRQSGTNNIVAVGQPVLHFNGIDWMEFSQLYPTYGSDCYTDGNEIFIVGNDNSRSFILHGM